MGLTTPILATPVLEVLRLAVVTQAGGVPANALLDEQGSPILDENGGMIYGD